MNSVWPFYTITAILVRLTQAKTDAQQIYRGLTTTRVICVITIPLTISYRVYTQMYSVQRILKLSLVAFGANVSSLYDYFMGIRAG